MNSFLSRVRSFWRDLGSEHLHNLFFVLLSLVAVVSVSWFGKALLQWLFSPNSGLGKNTELLAQVVSLSIGKLDPIHITFFQLMGCIVLFIVLCRVVYLYYKKVQTILAQPVLSSSTKNQLLEAKTLSIQHAGFLFFLLLFGISGSWLGDSLTNWLTDTSTRAYWAKFTITLIVLPILLVLIQHTLERIDVSKKLSWDKIITIAFLSLNTLAIVLLWFNFWRLTNTNHVVFFSFLLALSATHVFFEKVRKYATPSAVRVWGEKNGDSFPKHQHLILFLSSMDHKKDKSKDDPIGDEGYFCIGTTMATNLLEKLDKLTLSSKLLELLQQPDKSTNDEFKHPIIDKINTVNEESLWPEQSMPAVESGAKDAWFKNPFVIAGFVNTIVDKYQKDEETSCVEQLAKGEICVSRVLALYSSLCNKFDHPLRVNWQMPFIALQHHVKQSGKVWVTIVSSEDNKDTNGSAAQVSAFALLLKALGMANAGAEIEIKFYHHNQEQGGKTDVSKAKYWSLDNLAPDFEREGDCKSKDIPMCNGVDFNNFTLCKDLILNIARDSPVIQQDTVVDFTGGTKVTSMSVTMATTSSDIRAQYVSENDYRILGYDLRYYDLQKLGG